MTKYRLTYNKGNETLHLGDDQGNVMEFLTLESVTEAKDLLKTLGFELEIEEIYE